MLWKIINSYDIMGNIDNIVLSIAVYCMITSCYDYDESIPNINKTIMRRV